MDKQLEALNQRQLSTKKPVVDKEKTHYEWEDTGFSYASFPVYQYAFTRFRIIDQGRSQAL